MQRAVQRLHAYLTRRIEALLPHRWQPLAGVAWHIRSASHKSTLAPPAPVLHPFFLAQWVTRCRWLLVLLAQPG
jgi:hypothetical protein